MSESWSWLSCSCRSIAYAMIGMLPCQATDRACLAVARRRRAKDGSVHWTISATVDLDPRSAKGDERRR
jgi:hypothetical protein